MPPPLAEAWGRGRGGSQYNKINVYFSNTLVVKNVFPRFCHVADPKLIVVSAS